MIDLFYLGKGMWMWDDNLRNSSSITIFLNYIVRFKAVKAVKTDILEFGEKFASELNLERFLQFKSPTTSYKW